LRADRIDRSGKPHQHDGEKKTANSNAFQQKKQKKSAVQRHKRKRERECLNPGELVGPPWGLEQLHDGR